MSQLIERRELLKIAAATFAGLATSQKNFGMPRELVQNVAKAADWKPVFFNSRQMETVMVLTELIIPATDTPGANDANVHRYIDLFLSVANGGDQKQFKEGLAWLDEYSRKTDQAVFLKCGEGRQVMILNRMAGLDKTPIDAAGYSFFKQVKNMTSMIYFATPEGYRELNKFGPPPASVGCEHPAGHSTL